ncbi:fasciclin domain-containing protein [Paraflavisolibacter sp. H34]|uniref:fasciclin domain-containing protein n=1 Tax=Huijunlia imazamoxiresistens TaxID=3127457 RepID=UPI0030187405
MRSIKNNFLLWGLCGLVGLASCKKWDDHVAAGEQALNENLMEHIRTVPDLSTFGQYLVKTGLDQEISSSKTYTVWAPSNEALKSLPAEVVADTARLKAFLLNHISGQLFFTRQATDSLRVPMLNGKRVVFYRGHFDEAVLSKADVYVRNGALHVIDKVIAPLPSIWQFVDSTKNTFLQNAYLASRVYTAQDPTKAELDSINPATGQPVYKPNTGIVRLNTFLDKVYNLASEDSLYTYIVLSNNAFLAETNKQRAYFKSPEPAYNNSNSLWNVAKHLAIRGYYGPEQLPAALQSKFGVRVPINKAAILETRKLSNGIVYVLDEALFNQQEMVPVTYVQGENPLGFSATIVDKYLSKVFYRNRFDSLNNKPFKDIYLNLGSSGASQFVDYISNNLYSVKYKVYMVAYSDRTASGNSRDDAYGSDSTLTQLIRIGADTSSMATPPFSITTKVKSRDYSEVYLGEYTNDSYNWDLSYPDRTPDGRSYTRTPATRRIRLQAPATTVNSIPYNLTLDYLKFVPVIP